MKKQDYLIVGLLVVLLFAWLRYQGNLNRARLLAAREEAAARAAALASSNAVPRALAPGSQEGAAWGASSATNGSAAAGEPSSGTGTAAAPPEPEPEPESLEPERTVVLRSGELELLVSSKGATVRAAVLPAYSDLPGSTNAVRLEFAPQPALAFAGLPGFGETADFVIVTAGVDRVVLRRESPRGPVLERCLELKAGYRLEVLDRLLNAGSETMSLAAGSIALGTMRRGTSRNDLLGLDSLPAGPDARGRPPRVRHWERDLTALFTGGRRGRGCGGAAATEAMPLTVGNERDPPPRWLEAERPQEWIALKSRFFVQYFHSDTPNRGFKVALTRVPGAGPLRLDHMTARLPRDGGELAPGAVIEQRHTLYVGPKKLSLLRKLGRRTDEIMQFGVFRWLCVLLVPTLNFFYRLIPNYGVAIILLTVLVRVIFWPLTHKSTENMKRMQALQPQLNELRAKFKDDPRKLQQETMRIYRENKVNPMSSCLPMLIQIPVFIALFTVLRSAVELRYASFLWIEDLSEPENLLRGVLPLVPALNILPFLMAGTMMLQSRLTPSMGDPTQQKMMSWLMPAMMFFMFYSMPSALLLYWIVSQMLSIAQLLWQRRRQASVAGGGGCAGGEAAAAMTRQMRRRLSR
jgi:YidC/Oxa1 family membrane protein insertase